MGYDEDFPWLGIEWTDASSYPEDDYDPTDDYDENGIFRY